MTKYVENIVYKFGFIYKMKSNFAFEGRREEVAVSTLERETGGFITRAYVVLLLIVLKKKLNGNKIIILMEKIFK